jgi:MSHA biogenesis protein MshP
MSVRKNAYPRACRQQGFAAIAAIFLVVVLAALGAFMVGISNTEQIDSLRDLQASRAYWTAKAGLEWGLGAASAKASATGPASITAATCTSNLAIAGFTAVVTCTVNAYLDPNPTKRYIVQVTSVASIGGAPGALGYVTRTVTGTLER